MERGMLWAMFVCLVLAGMATAVATAESEAGHMEPKNVTAVCGTNSAQVSWSAVNDPHLSGYDIYKKASGEQEYTRANTDPVTTTHYTVLGLSSSTAYRFGVVSVFNDGHTSSMSTPVACTTG